MLPRAEAAGESAQDKGEVAAHRMTGVGTCRRFVRFSHVSKFPKLSRADERSRSAVSTTLCSPLRSPPHSHVCRATLPLECALAVFLPFSQRCRRSAVLRTAQTP